MQVISMSPLIFAIALPACAYFLGSIPFGLLFVRWQAGFDIRDLGSGNIGATNVKRALGTRWAVATLTCDALKGLLPVLGALQFTSGGPMWLPAVTAMAAISGHMFPLYLNFKPSGKGVATTLGCLLALAPWAGLLSITGFMLAVFITRRSSVGSLIATFILPPAAWFTTHDPAVSVSLIAVMVLIMARHEDNLQRLAHGVEPVIDFNWRKSRK